ncbi:hypothetical protein ACIQU5_13420 [Streptomyces sp. NPDC090306]|uniref:hypothetical protein n=1 Tax=unclassified Streptomyces TaxID=2593676 RepID=UPI0036E48FBB
MRLSSRLAPAVVAAALLTSLPFEGLPQTGVRDIGPVAPRLSGAQCRTTVDGSRVTAYCHNPYPATDRVSLHIECDRWWDVDSDGAPVATGPAQTVRLTGRCWKEIHSAWVGHDPRGR